MMVFFTNMVNSFSYTPNQRPLSTNSICGWIPHRPEYFVPRSIMGPRPSLLPCGERCGSAPGPITPGSSYRPWRKTISTLLAYVASSQDAFHMPPHVLYVIVVVVSCYAILGHLINDLYHDLAGKVGWSHERETGRQADRHLCNLINPTRVLSLWLTIDTQLSVHLHTL